MSTHNPAEHEDAEVSTLPSLLARSYDLLRRSLTLLVVVSFVAMSVIGYFAVASWVRNGSVLDKINSCVEPTGSCYKSGQTRTASIVGPVVTVLQQIAVAEQAILTQDQTILAELASLRPSS